MVADKANAVLVMHSLPHSTRFTFVLLCLTFIFSTKLCLHVFLTHEECIIVTVFYIQIAVALKVAACLE